MFLTGRPSLCHLLLFTIYIDNIAFVPQSSKAGHDISLAYFDGNWQIILDTMIHLWTASFVKVNQDTIMYYKRSKMCEIYRSIL